MRATLLFALLSAAAPALAQPRAPLATFKADPSVFIDDPFVIRDDGRAIAYISTDGANTAVLHVAPLPSGSERLYPGLPVDVDRLRFVAPDQVLVIERDPTSQKLSARIFTPTGPGQKQLGPVDGIHLGTVKGRPAILTYERREARGLVEHVVAAYDARSLRPLGSHTLKENAEGRIANPSGPFKILWWNDGYASAATLQAGAYDAKRDIRRPDRFARYDVFSGRILDAHEIGDVLGFAQASLAHQKHENQTAFVRFSDDHRKLLLTDGIAEHELTLARPLPMYDAPTLAYQPIDDKTIAVSLAVDPMNPQAAARKKADRNDFDLYLVDRATRKATLVLRLAGDGRPVTWSIGGGKVAVLHKSAGFDRGGKSLAVYTLDPIETAGR